MKPNEFGEFAEMLAAVAGVYSKEVSEMTMSLYFNALKDYDLAAVRRAFDAYVKNPDTGQFMPKPADLIRMMSGTTLDAALLAWSKVDKAVRIVGPWYSVAFDDPLIHMVISDMGGWPNFGNKTDDEWPFVQKEFENRYKGYKAHRGVSGYPPICMGMADAENATKGLKTANLRMFGDEQMVNSVISGGKMQNLQVSQPVLLDQLTATETQKLGRENAD